METESQLAALVAEGVSAVQGYLFSGAVTAAGLPAAFTVAAQAAPFDAIGITTLLPGGASAVNAVLGPAGPPGPPGAMMVYTASFTGLAAGLNVPLQTAPGGFQLLVINGRIEFPANYGVSGKTLVIPPDLTWDGCPCMFLYGAAAVAAATVFAPVTAELKITAPGQSFTFPLAIAAPLGLYIDGLRQDPSEFTFSGSTLTLASDIAGGDGLFEYLPA